MHRLEESVKEIFRTKEIIRNMVKREKQVTTSKCNDMKRYL